MEHVHRRGYVHRDIKPSNFLLGPADSALADVIHIADFGLAAPYSTSGYERILQVTSTDMQFISHHLVGTARYASISAHHGLPPLPRDDIEALAYMLLQFGGGSLPWQGMTGSTESERIAAILDCKASWDAVAFCAEHELPEELAYILRYAQQLAHDETPDYHHLRQLVRAGRVKDDRNVNRFEWSIGCNKSQGKTAVNLSERSTQIERDRSWAHALNSV